VWHRGRRGGWGCLTGGCVAIPSQYEARNIHIQTFSLSCNQLKDENSNASFINLIRDF